MDRADAARGDRVTEERLAEGIRSIWGFYRHRDLLQAHLFDGCPKGALERLRDRLLPATDRDDELVRTLQARNRYETVDFSPGNPQRRAFDRFLGRLAEARVPTLLFYAREDDARLAALLDASRYRRLRDELAAGLAPRLGPRLIYSAGLEGLPTAHYLDHIHHDGEGYARLAESLGPSIDALLRLKRP